MNDRDKVSVCYSVLHWLSTVCSLTWCVLVAAAQVGSALCTPAAEMEIHLFSTNWWAPMAKAMDATGPWRNTRISGSCGWWCHVNDGYWTVIERLLYVIVTPILLSELGELGGTVATDLLSWGMIGSQLADRHVVFLADFSKELQGLKVFDCCWKAWPTRIS